MPQNKLRRICMLGGPGCGKSTVAAWLFASMKARGHEIEYVTEVVKNWTFLRRPPEGFDQIYLFGKQMNLEDVVLRYNDNFMIVTDSPLFIMLFRQGDPCLQAGEELAASPLPQKIFSLS